MTQTPLAPGMILQARYRIERVLGGGGMGTVYLAADSRLGGRQCAVKELSDAAIPIAERPQVIADFQREAEMLAHLDHVGLAKVNDFFSETGHWYLVMEYVAGETLEAAALRSGGHVPEADVTAWALQLCEVLAYLHGRNPPVIFRDLKPANIILTPDGRIKLIDFGIARFFKPGQARDTRNLGTPGFAAPEQYGKGQTDARSDIYSLGVTLHTLLTGYDPALTPFALPVASKVNARISAGMDRVVQRAVQMDPQQRFQSVDEFRSALMGLARQTIVQPMPTPRPTKATTSRSTMPAQRSRPSVASKTSTQGKWSQLSLFLILGLVVYALGRWVPMLQTVFRSLQSYDILSPAKFVGLENYSRIVQDPIASIALRNVVIFLLLRLGSVLLVWWLLGRAWQRGRQISAGLAALAVVPVPVLSSVGMSFLWRALGNPLLGPFGALWSSPGSAFIALAVVETLHSLAVAAAIGLISYTLAQQSGDGRAVLRLTSRVMLVVSAMEALQSFNWSQIITAGGPVNSTTTPLLLLYRNQFQFFRIGYGAAHATLLLICAVILGWLLWRALRGSSLRLIVISGTNSPGRLSGGPLLGSLALLPWVVAVFPYAWLHFGVSQARLPFVSSTIVPLSSWLVNTFLASVLVIWLVQLPLALVTGHALATWRTGAALEHWLAWPFLMAALTSVGAISAELFIGLRQLGALNTWLGLVAPSIVNATAVVMFALLWDGFSIRSPLPDQQRTAVRLLYAALAVASSFAASQEFLWHLVSTSKAANYTVAPGLMSATQNMLQGNPVKLVEAAMLPIVVPSGLLLAGLTYLLLGRLAVETR